MDKGTIPINKNYLLEYRYYDRDSNFKYFNRKFEIFVLEKKTLKKNYVMHMDNADTRQMMPRIYKPDRQNKRNNFGVTTLNWNDIRTKFTDHIIDEIGKKSENNIKKAVGKLNSPKL